MDPSSQWAWVYSKIGMEIACNSERVFFPIQHMTLGTLIKMGEDPEKSTWQHSRFLNLK